MIFRTSKGIYNTDCWSLQESSARSKEVGGTCDLLTLYMGEEKIEIELKEGTAERIFLKATENEKLAYLVGSELH